MKRLFFAAMLVLFVATPSLSQNPMRLQGKVVLRAPLPEEPGWYLAGWNITNVRDEATDNINIIVGVGREMKNGRAEFMLQRQYSIHSSQWFLDFRFQRQFNRHVSLFVEVAPFLETAALYHFVRVEVPITKRLNVMVESENIHRNGKDSLGLGPGLSMRPMKLKWKLRLAPAIAWQLRLHDPDFIRFYLAFPF